VKLGTPNLGLFQPVDQESTGYVGNLAVVQPVARLVWSLTVIQQRIKWAAGL